MTGVKERHDAMHDIKRVNITFTRDLLPEEFIEIVDILQSQGFEVIYCHEAGNWQARSCAENVKQFFGIDAHNNGGTFLIGSGIEKFSGALKFVADAKSYKDEFNKFWNAEIVSFFKQLDQELEFVTYNPETKKLSVEDPRGGGTDSIFVAKDWRIVCENFPESVEPMGFVQFGEHLENVAKIIEEIENDPRNPKNGGQVEDNHTMWDLENDEDIPF